MPSIRSLPTEITAKILRIYVSCYLVPSFDVTRVPENDSSALEFRRLTERAELLAMLTVCKSFAAVLPEMIFKRVNIFSVSAVHKFRDAVSSRSLATGHFANALTYVEFSFSFGSDIAFGPLSTAPCIAEILQRAPNVRCVAFSFHPICPHFVSRLLDFAQHRLPSHVSAIIMHMETTNLSLSPSHLFDRTIWNDRTWPAFFASIPHVTDVTVITMQYIVWPPFPLVESAMKSTWLANASPAFQCLHLHFGHYALRHIALANYITQVQTGVVDRPDLLANISCGFTCSEWRRCEFKYGSYVGSIRFFRDKAPFPAATSAPEYARLFIFGKSLPFS
ncbi:hypothetical protein BDP27DRAFT_1436865 [Rhodocollybia butyracea]|uniref:Uncharacterized protein n=1 Tax=Rhodocollybia butyracea TaxID=206335 RepID=A0A9P5TW44_9AGAR|nr:hypothetical protein BDP27DRAFT_1436865 [Rhodocollybia butyracea]